MSDESLAAMENAEAPPIGVPASDRTSPAPLARGASLSSLDVLRGVAVLGILLMNIVMFGLPYWAYDDPSVVGGSTGLNLWTWIATNMFFEGTMRAMFSLLFGAGVILLTSRLESRTATSNAPSVLLAPADIYFRRNIWLIVFGLIHSYLLLWLGDILYAYGMVGLFLYVFRHVRPGRLILIAALLFGAVVTISTLERQATLSLIAAADEAEAAKALGEVLTEEQEEAIKEWTDDREERKPDAEEVQGVIDSMHRGYRAILLEHAPINVWLESKIFYKHGFFDAASMMFLGMALLKLGVLSGARSRAAYAGMLILGYGVGLTVNAYETSLIVRHNFAIEAFYQAGLTYDVGRLAMVFGHIGVIMLIIKSGALPRLMSVLASVGQMALTNYLAASIVCGLIFNGYGLGWYGRLERWQLYIVVLLVWAAQLIISPLWLRRFQFGPAEWLWRSLTYWRRQPMLRINAPPTTPPVV